MVVLFTVSTCMIAMLDLDAINPARVVPLGKTDPQITQLRIHNARAEATTTHAHLASACPLSALSTVFLE
jgi:hypothetical protein